MGSFRFSFGNSPSPELTPQRIVFERLLLLDPKAWLFDPETRHETLAVCRDIVAQ